VVLGWTDRMPEITRAADVVVTNAGGATSLEALACHRPVLMFKPIAGHGIANARAMATAGVAELCDDGDALAAALRRLLADDALRDRLAANAKQSVAAFGREAVYERLEALLADAARER
jgi:UDP-N-acetylglucosamine:LPS N-acetylglucosamine transferase